MSLGIGGGPNHITVFVIQSTQYPDRPSPRAQSDVRKRAGAAGYKKSVPMIHFLFLTHGSHMVFEHLAGKD